MSIKKISKVQPESFEFSKDSLLEAENEIKKYAEKLYFNYDALIHLAWQGLPNYKDFFHHEENLPYNYFFIKNIILCFIPVREHIN